MRVTYWKWYWHTHATQVMHPPVVSVSNVRIHPSLGTKALCSENCKKLAGRPWAKAILCSFQPSILTNWVISPSQMPSETIRDGSWYALNIRQKAFQMLFKRPTTLHWTKQPNWRELLNSVINHFSINDHSFFMRKNSNDFIDGLLFYR